jgi:hypothetical protein
MGFRVPHSWSTLRKSRAPTAVNASGASFALARFLLLAQPTLSLKEIGYELGLSLPTVSVNLKQALRKLRLKNRGELVAVVGRSPE